MPPENKFVGGYKCYPLAISYKIQIIVVGVYTCYTISLNRLQYCIV